MNPEHKQKSLFLTAGTAGHIDHGKTELVKYLTGCNTDRLPEEQLREMTIDLGFTTCDLPDNRRIGIVDVPGHEKFIHNMVAGAAGIDIVILVIAADDGIMPQTVEHLHIVRLLGVRSGMIVITKTDLVDNRRVEKVKSDAAALVAGSFLENKPVVRFSARTGEGFNNFYKAFTNTVSNVNERSGAGVFRLHIERSFTLKGVGTVISGIPSSGSVSLGENLELLPTGETKRVKGIQVYGQNSNEARAGECVALRLSDVSRKDIQRGMVLAKPDFFKPSEFINAKIQVLPSIKKPLKPRTSIRLHIGTDQIPAHIVLPTLNPLPPGHESYVQIQLKRAVIAAPGDFFVIRTLSPVTTIGGGYVICPTKLKIRRSKGEWAAKCRKHEDAFKDPGAAIAYVLENSSTQPVSLKTLAQESFLTLESAEKHLDYLCMQGKAVRLNSKKAASAKAVSSVSGKIIAQLNRMHCENPMSMGFSKQELAPRLNEERALMNIAIEKLISQGKALSTEKGLSIPGCEPSLTGAKKLLADRIERCYMDGKYRTPRKDELPRKLGVPLLVLNPIFNYLIEIGTLVKLDDNVVLHQAHLDSAKKLLINYLHENGSIESSKFRDLLDTSRKFVIPLLEYWDAQGLTKRSGNERALR